MAVVVLTKAAAREWQSLADRIERIDPSLRAVLAADMSAILGTLELFPRGFPLIAPRLRRAVLTRWSHGLFYRLSGERIVIVAMIDLRRDPAAIRRRLGLHEGAADFTTGSAIPISSFDPTALTVDERLQLTDELWLSIARDAKSRSADASAVLDLNRPLDPELLAELQKRATALKCDPSSGIRWEDVRAELKSKYE